MRVNAKPDQPAISLLVAGVVVAAILCTPGLTFASRGRGVSKQRVPRSAGAVTLDPAGITFFDQLVGSLGPGQQVTLTNNGTVALSITKIAASAGFTSTNNCGI